MAHTRKLIGIFATEVSSRIQGNLYTELHKRAKELGYTLVLCSGTYEKIYFRNTAKATKELFKIAELKDFAAFIIHVQSLGDKELIQYLIGVGNKKKIPVFAYDCEPLGITADDGVIPVNLDYKQGFAQGVKHLIEDHKCRNIFMLAGIKNNKYSEDRIDAYKEEMDKHGIAYSKEMIGYGDFWENPAIEAVNKFLDSDLPRPEAICCANDSMAIAAIKVLNRRGLRVPEDVLVTGFDGIEEGKFNYPRISTCEPDLTETSKFIFDVIEGNNNSSEFMIPLHFYPKESCSELSDMMEDKRELSRLVENSRISSWQHHMLSTMQFELIDSCNIQDIEGFMNGTLDLFKDYGHLYCFRKDLETESDYTGSFDTMKVFLNKDFMTQAKPDSFDFTDVIPQFDAVINDASKEDIFAVRLIHNGDKLYGYHFIKSPIYSSSDFKLIGQFTESVTIVIETILRNIRLNQANLKLSEMYDRMAEIYIRDVMTGLYNRNGYYQNIESYMKQAESQNSYVHIISIDMDGMKQINDNYGHFEGDNAIKAVAKAIQDCFEQPCISARFGGDEFMVALFTTDDCEPRVEHISKMLNDYLANMPELKDKKYKVAVSVGKSVAKLSEVEDITAVERIADDCMYEDKRRRKSSR